MAGGKGAPYRAPCGGWQNRPPYLGSCTNHFRRSESVGVSSLVIVNGGSGYTTAEISIAPPDPNNPLYGQRARAKAKIAEGVIVATEVVDPGWGYSTPPQVTIQGDGTGAILAAELTGPKLLLNVECAQGCPPNGPQQLYQPEDCQSPLVHHDSNCYAEVDWWVDMSACSKVGWKGLAMEKTWHGAMDFMHDLEPDTPISRKFLSIRRHVEHESRIEQYSEFEMAQVWTAEANATTLISVNPTSGAFRQDSHSFQAQAYFWMVGYEEPEPTESALCLFAPNSFYPRYAGAISAWGSLTPSAGKVSLPDDYFYSPRFTGTPEEVEEFLIHEVGWDSASVQLTATMLRITLSKNLDTGFDPDGNRMTHTETALVEIELSGETIPADLLAYVRPEISGWDFGDDIQMPWRTDNNCQFVPLIRWDEARTYSDPARIGLSEEPMNFPDQPTGEIIGKPVPTARTIHGQRWVPFLHWDVRNGAWVPFTTGLPTATTHWKEWIDSPTEMPGAGAGWVFWQSSEHRLTLGVYAEIFSWVPSHNFARPCGPDRFRIDTRDASYYEAYGLSYCDAMDEGRPALYLFRDSNNQPVAPPICGRIRVKSIEPVDQGLVRLVLAPHDPPHSLRTGDTIEISGIPGMSGQATVTVDGGDVLVAGAAPSDYDGRGFIQSPGAADWKWNDDQAKGEYAVKTILWKSDGELMVKQSELCATKCVERTPCCPAAIMACPGGYEQPWPRCVLSVESIDLPGILYYGRNSAAAILLKLRRTDPLWVPSPEEILCENGVQFYIGDPPPQVEMRCGLPDGAPALPAGFVYGGATDPELTFDGLSCPHHGILQ